MPRPLQRIALLALIASGLTWAATATATVPSRGYFNSSGIYDCQTYSAVQHYWTTVDVYEFFPSGAYEVSIGRNGRTLDKPVTSGHYRLVGNRIIPSSGVLYRSHEYMKILSDELQVLKNNGHLTGLNCELRYPKPKPKPPAVSVGKYTCVQTVENSPGSYGSSTATTITFYNNDTYWTSGGLGPWHWHQSGSQVVFTDGPLWTSVGHDVGILHPSGVTMPHAQPPFSPTAPYTLVIKDSVAHEGGVPPSVEWSSTDGPNGSYTTPQSFYYCSK